MVQLMYFYYIAVCGGKIGNPRGKTATLLSFIFNQNAIFKAQTPGPNQFKIHLADIHKTFIIFSSVLCFFVHLFNLNANISQLSPNFCFDIQFLGHRIDQHFLNIIVPKYPICINFFSFLLSFIVGITGTNHIYKFLKNILSFTIFFSTTIFSCSISPLFSFLENITSLVKSYFTASSQRLYVLKV